MLIKFVVSGRQVKQRHIVPLKINKSQLPLCNPSLLSQSMSQEHYLPDHVDAHVSRDPNVFIFLYSTMIK